MNIESGITIEGNIRIGSQSIPTLNAVEVFTTSTVWTMPANRYALSARMLLVAGGGAGGSGSYNYYYGGGGGAGGCLSNVDITTSLIPGQSYTIAVGAGGGAVFAQAPGGSGGNSTAFGYTAIGGGGGGTSTGLGGGSGGGGGAESDARPGGTGIAGQGSAGGKSDQGVGGTGNIWRWRCGGGGGGAGGVGQDAFHLGVNFYATGGDHGPGIYSNISGTNVYYAEGGEGGTYNDADTIPNTNANHAGLASTTPGGGGGGGCEAFLDYWATNGQAGICIISYDYIPYGNS